MKTETTNETMNILLVKPNARPQSIKIGCKLEDMQKAVGGYIQAIYPFDEPVALIMDEDGKMKGKSLNRTLRSDGEIYDVITGDFLVVGIEGENFCSLSDELMKNFEQYFYQPEMFVRMGDHIAVLPLPEEEIVKENLN